MVAFKREEDYSQYVNKAKENKAASGGSVPGGGYVQAPAFGAYASGGGASAGPRIPVWRRPSPTGGRAVPRGPNPFTSAVTGAPANLFNVPGKVKNFTDPGNDAPTFDADGAAAEFGRILMDPELLSQWGELARKAIPGFGPDDMNNPASLQKAWEMAVGWSIMFAQTTGKMMTPFEAAELVGENTGAGMFNGLADAKSRARDAQEQRDWDYAHFTGTRDLGTSTDTDQQAGTRNMEALHQLLGRNPTSGEQAAFQEGMNSIAAKNPTVTKRKGTFKEGHQTSQTETVSGGFDETGAIRQQAAKASPEVAANQRATTYYDALVRAIGAAV